MRVASLLVAGLLAAALAGCSSPPAHREPAPETSANEASPYTLTCLPGGTQDPETEVCRVEYGPHPGGVFFMQRLRASPAQPGVVVGAGIETLRSGMPGYPRLDPTNPGLEFQRPVVHVSEDGGATWTKRAVPHVHPDGLLLPVDYASQTHTADVAIDADGALHLLLSVQPQVLTFMQGEDPTAASTRDFLYAIRSTDLGRTWEEPVDLGARDTTWYPRIETFGAGQIAAFFVDDGVLNVTVSRDGGRTWTPALVVPEVAGADEIPSAPSCEYVGFVAAWNGSLYVPCWTGVMRTEPGTVRIGRLDADGTLRELEQPEIAPACTQFMLVAGLDGLALVGSGCPGLLAATSVDGKAWTSRDLPGLLSVDGEDDDWSVPSLAAAPDGSLHLVLARGDRVAPTVPDPTGFGGLAEAVGPRSVTTAYASFDPGFAAVRSEALLQESNDPCLADFSSLIGVQSGIVFWPGGGLVGYDCIHRMLVAGLQSPATES